MPITRELQVKFCPDFFTLLSVRLEVHVLQSSFCPCSVGHILHSGVHILQFTISVRSVLACPSIHHELLEQMARPIELDSHSDSWIALGQSNSPRNSRIAFFFQIRSTLKYIEAVNRFSNLFYCVCVHALIWINRKSSKPAGFFCSPVTCDVFIQSE